VSYINHLFSISSKEVGVTVSSIFGHVDFLGKGATTPLEDVCTFFTLPLVTRAWMCYSHKDNRLNTARVSSEIFLA